MKSLDAGLGAPMPVRIGVDAVKPTNTTSLRPCIPVKVFDVSGEAGGDVECIHVDVK